MARFDMILPDEVVNNMRYVYGHTKEIFGAMTKAGAEVVYKNVIHNMKNSFSDASKLEPFLRITKTYRTPSDDGINNKVSFYGYYKKGERTHTVKVEESAGYTYYSGKNYKMKKQSKGRVKATYTYDGIPVPLIAIAREFGTSKGEQKKPFFRKSFNKSQITAAMLKAQKEASGGLLE